MSFWNILQYVSSKENGIPLKTIQFYFTLCKLNSNCFMYYWLFTSTENINLTLRLGNFEARLRFLMNIFHLGKYWNYITISSRENNEVSHCSFHCGWKVFYYMTLLLIYPTSKLRCPLMPLQKRVNKPARKKGYFSS